MENSTASRWTRESTAGPDGESCPANLDLPDDTHAGVSSTDGRRRSVPEDWRIEVFYDGECPLCKREIQWLRRLDRKQKIRFTDIAAAGFRAEDRGATHTELMEQIHGRLPDGTWLRGVEVFRQLYSAVGWELPVRLSRLPIVTTLLDRAYAIFARNRLRWTGRCSSCARPTDTESDSPNRCSPRPSSDCPSARSA